MSAKSAVLRFSVRCAINKRALRKLASQAAEPCHLVHHSFSLCQPKRRAQVFRHFHLSADSYSRDRERGREDVCSQAFKERHTYSLFDFVVVIAIKMTVLVVEIMQIQCELNFNRAQISFIRNPKHTQNSN